MNKLMKMMLGQVEREYSEDRYVFKCYYPPQQNSLTNRWKKKADRKLNFLTSQDETTLL